VGAGSSGAECAAGGRRDCAAVSEAGREVFGKLGMPRPGCFRYSALGSHLLFDHATAIITLVRFHWSPLR